MNELILVVDDEYDLRELLRYNLEKENYKTVVARNGKEAIDSIQCHMPDLILLDVMMSGLDGWEVCRIVKKNAAWNSIPIIMLTALSDERNRIMGLRLGADDYLSKPFSLSELLLKVRKNLEQHSILKNLQASEREKETSLRYFIHEMGNSLTTISGFSSLAIKKNGEQRHLKMINTIALHAESLLRDATLLSQLEKDHNSLPLESMNIAAMAEEVIDFFDEQAKRKNIEVLLMQKNHEIMIKANKTAIRQVLINILANAIKYNKENGKVWVSFEITGKNVNVIITDEGCGIAQDEIARIFEKFYRASGSESVKGAGLGLYIVKLLTESMRGKISAFSVPGSGSSFILTFLQENDSKQDIRIKSELTVQECHLKKMQNYTCNAKQPNQCVQSSHLKQSRFI